MTSQRFKKLVNEALQQLPLKLQSYLANVLIHIQSRPTREQLRQWHIQPDVHLLGFYHGVPVGNQSKDAPWRLPDEIYIFRKPIQDVCRNDEEVRQEVKQTVWHEIAHHFGFEEQKIKEWK